MRIKCYPVSSVFMTVVLAVFSLKERTFLSSKFRYFFSEKKKEILILIIFLCFFSFESLGSMIGRWDKVVQPVKFQKGYNDFVLLSQTVGLQVKDSSLLVSYSGFACKRFNILAKIRISSSVNSQIM